MLTRFITLLVLLGALGVFGQDAPTPAIYTFSLEHVAIHGRITGVVDGDTINVLIQAGQQIRVHQQIRVRIAFIDAPKKGQPFGLPNASEDDHEHENRARSLRFGTAS